MPLINPYIHFNGNAEEAFHFYRDAFGGAFARVMRFREMQTPEQPFPEAEADKIAHIALPIGQHNILMGSDVPSFMGTVNEQENRSKISISAESREEADTLFNRLSAGGKVEYPMSDSAWGSYFGMFRDKFGIEWMIDYDERFKGKV